MRSWLNALARTRDRLFDGLARLMPGTGRPDAASLEAWEEALIRADIPARLAGELVEAVRKGEPGVPLRALIERHVLGLLTPSEPFAWISPRKPIVILIVGVNGSGKTTTAAKLAHLAKGQGAKPLLAAADTFRAAGADQLRIWAERLGCDVVAGTQGADAAAVAYDAAQAAVARQSDVVLVDTAGRMHTRRPLMEELQKVRRSLGKALDGAPHESWIVLDATLGQNAVVQARMFKEAIDLTGVVIAKLDGSSKGGFVLAIGKELGLPIRFVGLGEGADDLVPFDRAEFVKGLLGEEKA